MLTLIQFLSTLSLRRATIHYDNYNLHCVISIHALLAESDDMSGATGRIFRAFLSTLSLRRATKTFVILPKQLNNFYPRSPCGERPHNTKNNCIDCCISIHALLAESDENGEAKTENITLFLSTLSLRRATNLPSKPIERKLYFYPRSPCGERPLFSLLRDLLHNDFYPRSPCGERQGCYTVT